jgi:hypothetical protein
VENFKRSPSPLKGKVMFKQLKNITYIKKRLLFEKQCLIFIDPLDQELEPKMEKVYTKGRFNFKDIPN